MSKEAIEQKEVIVGKLKDSGCRLLPAFFDLIIVLITSATITTRIAITMISASMSSSPITTNATNYTTVLFLFLEKSYYYLYGKPQQAQKNYDCYEVCCVKFQIDSHLNIYYTFDAANEVLSGLGEVEEYAVSMHDQFAAFFPTTMVAVSFFCSTCLTHHVLQLSQQQQRSLTTVSSSGLQSYSRTYQLTV